MEIPLTLVLLVAVSFLSYTARLPPTLLPMFRLYLFPRFACLLLRTCVRASVCLPALFSLSRDCPLPLSAFFVCLCPPLSDYIARTGFIVHS